MDRFRPSFLQFLNRDIKNAFLFWLLNIIILASAVFIFIDINYEGPLVLLAIALVAQAINVYKDYKKYKQIYR